MPYKYLRANLLRELLQVFQCDFSEVKIFETQKMNTFLLNQILRNPVEGISSGLYIKGEEFVIFLKNLCMTENYNVVLILNFS